MDPKLTALLGAFVLGLDVLAVTRAVLRDHGVERTLMWLFCILAFPALGALAYLALASPSVRRTTRRKLASAGRARRVLANAARAAGERGAPDVGVASLFALAERLTGLPPTGGNRPVLMAENDAAFDRIEQALTQAKRRIWAEYYIVQNDATGRAFLELLARKASEGLDVRFIHDSVGSHGIDEGLLAKLRDAGGHTAAFLPLNPLLGKWSVHLRNHRKLVLVDDRLAFTGGMNIGDEYSGRSRKLGPRRFHDTHLEVEGPAVQSLATVFAEDWTFAADEPLEHLPPPFETYPGDAVVGVLPSGPDQKPNATRLAYFSAVASAKQRVWLTSPYFIPDEPFQLALTAAALRGVDVRVLVPSKGDVRLAQAAARPYCRLLARNGIRVFRYLPAMLHGKTMLIDDELSLVGSANADIRSFRLNFELGALIRCREFAESLAERFRADQAQSDELTAEEASAASVPTRFADGVARLLSPLL